jgi:hypothetical protein
MKQFEHFLTMLLTILLIGLYITPIYMSWLECDSKWCLLYIPIFLFTFGFLIIIFLKKLVKCFGTCFKQNKD